MPSFDFNPNELHQLGRIVFAAGRARLDEAPGSRRTRRVGEGTDFMDFRQYAPGDDFRRVDWNLYGRLRQLFIRLHEAPRQLSVSLLVDLSRSMTFGAPQAKMSIALRAACALAFVALRGGDRVYGHCFSAGLTASVGPLANPSSLSKFVKFLQSAKAGVDSDLPAAIRDLRARRLCKGLLIILSDFMIPADVDAALAQVSASGARAVAVQILDEIDRGVGLRGSLRLRDSESGQRVDLQLDERALGQFQAHLENRRQQFEDSCRRRQQLYVLADTRAPYLQTVGQVLRAKAVAR